jgi:hypothetical protein
MKLGDLLVRAGCLTEEQLQAALAEQKRWGGRLGEILIEKGFCSEDLVARALAKQLNLEVADLEGPLEMPASILTKLPHRLACELNVVPYRCFERERTLAVAMADARDKAKIEQLERRTGWRIVPVVASAHAITAARARLYRVKEEEELAAEDTTGKLIDSQGRTLVRSIEELAREREERRAAQAARARAQTPAPQAQRAVAPAAAPTPRGEEIEGFTDARGRTKIRSIEEIRREARERKGSPAAEADLPSRAELLATIEALQNEVKALKAVAVVLFKKGYLTHAEYIAQLEDRAP